MVKLAGTSLMVLMVFVAAAEGLGAGGNSAQQPAPSGGRRGRNPAVEQPPSSRGDGNPRAVRPQQPIPLPPQPPPNPPASSPSENRVSMRTDGSIESRMSDGTVRVTKPSVCGWVDEFPDGRKSAVRCQTNVQPATPPFPSDTVSRQWVASQNDKLLSILESMLDEASVRNYLAAYEHNSPNIEQRFLSRLGTIQTLAAAVGR
jgi:hypothetical protein